MAIMPISSLIDRRTFLRLLGKAGVAGLAIAAPPLLTSAEPRRETGRWSDPATWGGSVPSEGDIAIVAAPVVLDVDVRVAGVVIQPEGQLTFLPRRDVRLETTGNVVVSGRLSMRPEDSRADHRIVFVGVDEASFVGGGMDVLQSDVGLWVIDAGVLDLAGSRKLAWTRTANEIRAGATTIRLREDPTGWRAGDELVLTPTLSPTRPDHHLAYDSVTVKAIDGRTVKLSAPTRFAHPRVTVGRGHVLTAEVLNLTRNVGIEGTADGRAHVFIRSRRAQKIRNVSVRYMGPRQLHDEYSTGVLGRYPLHFHDCENGSRGSIVMGVVARECGNHAFVPHQSHGVRFRDCIAHDVFDDAFWWDPVPAFTDDTVFDQCLASLVRSDPPVRGYRLTGFQLGAANGNIARGCVAVGVQGNSTAAGFVWPESTAGSWTFQDCVAHNNNVHGIFVWQNNGLAHPITRFVGYHNGGAGISHGAYKNGYHYSDSILFANARSSLELHALSRADRQLTFRNLFMDQGDLTPHCVVTAEHGLPAELPVLFQGCDLRGHTHSAFAFLADATNPEFFDIFDCTFEGNEFWLGDDIHADSLIHVRDAVHGDIQLRPVDQPGQPRPKWNASVAPR